MRLSPGSKGILVGLAGGVAMSAALLAATAADGQTRDEIELVQRIRERERGLEPTHRYQVGDLRPGDTLNLRWNGASIEFVVTSGAGGLACAAAVPDIPAREWADFAAATPAAGVAAALGPDATKAIGVQAWRLARCFSPPPADRSCDNMPDWTGAEIRHWASALIGRHPGLAFVAHPLLDGVDDEELEAYYDATRAFARRCPPVPVESALTPDEAAERDRRLALASARAHLLLFGGWDTEGITDDELAAALRGRR